MGIIMLLFGCLIAGLTLVTAGLVIGSGLITVFLAVSFVAFLFIFWILMIVSAIKNPGLSDGEKICWVLAIIFFHIIGSLLYLLIGYPKRNRPPVFAQQAAQA